MAPWCIWGDFNTVLRREERKGGLFNRSSVRNFHNFILQAQVIDIPLQGIQFTWSNNRVNGCWARLDRFLVSPIILSWYPNMVQVGFPRSIYDHSAVTLGVRKAYWGPRPFRFFNSWSESKELMANVRSTWIGTKLTGSLSHGLHYVHVSSLQFTDDTILFIQPKAKYIKNDRRIMRCFELASGLKINFLKSCVVQVGKIRGAMTNWGELFGCPNVSLPIMYLGLPLGGRPGLKSFWMDLIQRVELRLAPWKKKFLNKGGRLVLIKAVLSSIPTYYMSVFKLPVWVAQKLERIQRNFFLGDGLERKKIHAVKWANLCKNKENGGLGIGSILSMNKGLLARWVWRFGVEESSLWKRVICAKYNIPLKSMKWDWFCGAKGSCFIKTIAGLCRQDTVHGKLLEEGLVVVLGRGDKPRLWSDMLVEGQSLKVVFPRIHALACDKVGYVREFGYWEGTTWVWEVKLRRPVFSWEVQQWDRFRCCLHMFTVQNNVSDTIMWKFDSSHMFTVKSFWRRLSEDQSDPSRHFKNIWRGFCPPKIEIFVWQLIKGGFWSEMCYTIVGLMLVRISSVPSVS
ncbi:hypothetical protein Dsin_001830 [Dipteronia sinensis]|uniref:Reverse transcriptase zinc-binding domain-containing protein n=1 Tax=Dipteronia sinensis TaxID=43782 RepID=A0AAE0B645_9ROSI|nr:hypothetical protein Dsin_001830 [Dipteronia sinensis]